MVKFFKIELKTISKQMLFLLIFFINFREPFFHLRELLFAITIVCSIPYLNYKYIIYSGILLLMGTISGSYNMIVPGSNIANGWLDPFIGAAYLLIFCFETKIYRKIIIKAYIFSSYVIALITIILWGICFFIPIIGTAIRNYFNVIEQTKNLMWCHIDWRYILGVRFMTVYYRTSPCIVCSLGYLLAEKLKGKKGNDIGISLFTLALFFSGARANMLAAFILLGSYYIINVIRKGEFSWAWFVLMICFLVAIVFIILFLSDKGSSSSNIKKNDFIGYMDLFDTDYLRTLFFGWGAGSFFYSYGRQDLVNVTELSFFETIRRYGLLPTLFFLFYFWLKPSIEKFRINIRIEVIFYIIPIIAYLLIAFTNPFLIDSFGFCALLFIMTYYKYGEVID